MTERRGGPRQRRLSMFSQFNLAPKTSNFARFQPEKIEERQFGRKVSPNQGKESKPGEKREVIEEVKKMPEQASAQTWNNIRSSGCSTRDGIGASHNSPVEDSEEKAKKPTAKKEELQRPSDNPNDFLNSRFYRSNHGTLQRSPATNLSSFNTKMTGTCSRIFGRNKNYRPAVRTMWQGAAEERVKPVSTSLQQQAPSSTMSSVRQPRLLQRRGPSFVMEWQTRRCHGIVSRDEVPDFSEDDPVERSAASHDHKTTDRPLFEPTSETPSVSRQNPAYREQATSFNPARRGTTFEISPVPADRFVVERPQRKDKQQVNVVSTYNIQLKK